MSRLYLLTIIVLAALFAAFVPAHAQDAGDSRAMISYFPILPLDAPPEMRPELLPVTCNHPLEGAHPGFTRAIIGIHDVSRNAQGVVTVLSALAGTNNATAFILAPQFLLPSDLSLLYQDVPKELLDQFATWPMNAWETGGESYAKAPQRPISSFTALDLLLVYLADKKYFPDLEEVVIAGHGAGANFVQLYAALGRATDLLEKQDVHVRFIVANASSYLYFTASRPKPNYLGFATGDNNACDGFNDYPYGLANLNGYAQRAGANAAKAEYAARSMTYLTGETITAADPYPDTSCKAMFEGANDAARAWNYNRYLSQIFGDAVTAKQKFYVVPKSGYDPIALLGSSCSVSVLFGDGSCGTAAPAAQENSQPPTAQPETTTPPLSGDRP